MRLLSYHKLLNFRVTKWRQALLASMLAISLPAVADKANIISIDFCADQYLLALADKTQIQAVSYEAVGPRSFYGTRAEGLSKN